MMAERETKTDAPAQEAPKDVQEPRYWRYRGWIARVIKNEDDDGWAVEMSREGDPEPLLTGPWTMGRDKKNPKPLDHSAFTTLIKTASEVLRRSEHHRDRMLHKSVSIGLEGGARVRVKLDIVPDDDDPHAFLSAVDDEGNELAKFRVAPNFKLTQASAEKFVKNDYREP